MFCACAPDCTKRSSSSSGNKRIEVDVPDEVTGEACNLTIVSNCFGNEEINRRQLATQAGLSFAFSDFMKLGLEIEGQRSLLEIR